MKKKKKKEHKCSYLLRQIHLFPSHSKWSHVLRLYNNTSAQNEKYFLILAFCHYIMCNAYQWHINWNQIELIQNIESTLHAPTTSFAFSSSFSFFFHLSSSLTHCFYIRFWSISRHTCNCWNNFGSFKVLINPVELAVAKKNKHQWVQWAKPERSTIKTESLA